MVTKVLINGARGKMGQITIQTLMQYPAYQVVGALQRSDDLAATIKTTEAQVVIDFTHAAVAYQNTEIIINSGAAPIIGTSGLTKDDVHTLQALARSKRVGGIIAPNFSIGAVWMMQLAAQAMPYFPAVEIIERHHAGKIDSPSGTAVRTAELLAAHTKDHAPPTEKATHETLPGARGAKYQHIPIHSIRLPGVMAEEEIVFGNTGETLTIAHRAIDRQCYMPGVLLALSKVLALKELVYGLEMLF